MLLAAVIENLNYPCQIPLVYFVYTIMLWNFPMRVLNFTVSQIGVQR